MKKLTLICMGIIALFISHSADATTYSFSDKDFLSGASWGTMTITAVDAGTLKVQYDAAQGIPEGSEATGFGFAFIPSTMIPTSILNPAAADFSSDRDDLNWISLANLNAIPNPSNGDEFTPEVEKNDFFFGATEGNANNLTPPGIKPGETDIFYLNFIGTPDLTTIDLHDFVYLTGVRLQSLPNDINGGSLFLVDPDKVPEPGMMLLFGSGLVGLAFFGRKK